MLERLPETSAFPEEAEAHETPELPAAVLFREHSADVVRVIFCALVSVVSPIFSVFTLSYAVNTMHIPRATMLTLLILANVIALGAIPAWAILADKYGCKPIFILGALGTEWLDARGAAYDNHRRYCSNFGDDRSRDVQDPPE